MPSPAALLLPAAGALLGLTFSAVAKRTSDAGASLILSIMLVFVLSALLSWILFIVCLVVTLVRVMRGSRGRPPKPYHTRDLGRVLYLTLWVSVFLMSVPYWLLGPRLLLPEPTAMLIGALLAAGFLALVWNGMAAKAYERCMLVEADKPK